LVQVLLQKETDFKESFTNKRDQEKKLERHGHGQNNHDNNGIFTIHGNKRHLELKKS
jgi:hypothetical protein